MFNSEIRRQDSDWEIISGLETVASINNELIKIQQILQRTILKKKDFCMFIYIYSYVRVYISTQLRWQLIADHNEWPNRI